MTVIKFPGSEEEEDLETGTQDILESIRTDMKSLEEHCEENQENLEGVVLISFSPKEYTHCSYPVCG